MESQFLPQYAHSFDQVPYAGVSGHVLECWDAEQEAYVAVKVVRDEEKYKRAAGMEEGFYNKHQSQLINLIIAPT